MGRLRVERDYARSDARRRAAVKRRSRRGLLTCLRSESAGPTRSNVSPITLPLPVAIGASSSYFVLDRDYVKWRARLLKVAALSGMIARRRRQRGEPVAQQHAHERHDHLHGHSHAPLDYGRAFAFGIALNLAYVAAEAAAGAISGSLALLADAGHNLGDALALGLSWGAAVLSRRRPSHRFTYGLKSSSILAALGHAINP